MSESTTVHIQSAIDRLRAGDDRARGDLISHSQRRLETLARSMLRGERVRRWEDSGDLCQDASCRLWTALQEVTPNAPADFFRLAATVIRRLLIDLARRHFGPQGIGANHESNPVGQALSSAAPQASESGPATLAEWTEFHELVSKLPDEERAAFDLVYYQGLTHDEAAASLGISVWTLRRHYRNASERLYKWLSDHDEKDGPQS